MSMQNEEEYIIIIPVGVSARGAYILVIVA